MALTSLSEGQPLVMLEAASMGLPMICTDVGGCREIVEGGEEDNLGLCGIVTLQSAPLETAKGILRLIKKKRFFSRCSKVARLRVEKFYDQELLFKEYREVYKSLLE